MKIVERCIRCKLDSFEGKIFSASHSQLIDNCPVPLVGITFEPVVCDKCRTEIGTNFADNFLILYKQTHKNELKD